MKIKFQLNVSFGSHKDLTDNRPQPRQRISFVECVRNEVEMARKRKSFSTASNYSTALRSLLKYVRRADIWVDEMSGELLKSYQKWLLERNVGLNTVSCYMRSLRSVYVKMGHSDKSIFKDVFTGRAPTVKRSICRDDITRLMKLKLRKGSRMDFTRDIFLFSFLCQGMPFVDVAHLHKSQITDRHISYHRKKTGQSVNIAIEPSIERIINRYSHLSGEYVFPILTTGDEQQQYKQYLRELSYYNRSLKALARKAGLGRKLTSYVARHSWASIAFESNVELSVISRAMGHTNPMTTMIYIRELDNDRIEQANRKVIDACRIDKGKKTRNKM
mgnify:CR=1 FL=1